MRILTFLAAYSGPPEDGGEGREGGWGFGVGVVRAVGFEQRVRVQAGKNVTVTSLPDQSLVEDAEEVLYNRITSPFHSPRKGGKASGDAGVAQGRQCKQKGRRTTRWGRRLISYETVSVLFEHLCRPPYTGEVKGLIAHIRRLR